MPPRISARHVSLLTATLLAAAGCSEQHPGEDTPITDAPIATDAPTAADAGAEMHDAMIAMDTPPAVDAGVSDAGAESDADLDAYYYPDGVRG